MSDLRVAQEISNQIGKIAFRFMGAKDLVGGKNFLQFKVGCNPKNIRTIRVTLEPSDTYTVDFFNSVGRKIHSSDDVYCDSLKNVIESNTGLYLSF